MEVVEEEEVEVVETLAEVEDMEVQICICSHFCFMVYRRDSQSPYLTKHNI